MAWYAAAVAVAVMASGAWLLLSPRSYARIMLRNPFLVGGGRGLSTSQMHGLWGYLAQTTARLRSAGVVMLVLGVVILLIAMQYR